MDTNTKRKSSNKTLDEQLNKLSKEISSLKTGAIISGILSLIMFSVFDFVLGLAAAVAVFVFILFIKKKNREKKMAVIHLIKDVIREKIDATEYNPNKCIPESAINNTGLMPHWDEFSGSDLVQGIYKGVTVAFSDIHLVDIDTYTDSDGHRHTTRTTVFQGQWIVCELPKAIKHTVRIKERPRFHVFPLKSDVETENMQFNEKYQILTKDPHTMFYILTPHFMEYILSADLLAEGQTYFCFQGNRVYIAIDNRRDSFEMKNKYESVKEVRERFAKEVQYLVEIIDELKKNKYLFGGED